MNRGASKHRSAVTAAAVFADWLEQLEAAPQILVGFSGGLDSTVLLHLLCELLPPERITAVHIHHGLSVMPMIGSSMQKLSVTLWGCP